MVGRPRQDLDQYKDLLIELYRKNTPWPRIEQILLTEHGCKVHARNIKRRFKKWNVASHRFQTDRSDLNLRARLQEIWADRGTRPKSDVEVHQRLTADGFKVTMRAIASLRKDMGLFRRWDERLGRWRPDSELPEGRKKRRIQKHSVFTTAQLAPRPDESDGDQAHFDESEYAPLASTPDEDGSGYHGGDDTEDIQLDSVPQPQTEPEPVPQPQSPQISTPASPAPATNHVPKKRGRPRKQPPPDQPTNQPVEPVQTTPKPRQVNPQPLTVLYAKKNT